MIQVMDIAGVSQGDSGIGHCWGVTRRFGYWTLVVCHKASEVLDVVGVLEGESGVGCC